MSDATFSDQSFAAVQRALPTRMLSNGVHSLTRIQAPWFKNALIQQFMKGFNISLAEAEVQDPSTFASFNEFFTRALKPGVRPIAAGKDVFACPVDGTISQFGPLNSGTLVQAKGHTYSAQDLLGGNAEWAAEFAGGQFMTIYLAPYNYHRIHMPVTATLRQWSYVPGRLFSVNHATARALPGVFARNERVVAIFDTDFGPLAMVLVGALFVGSIETVWAGEINPPETRADAIQPVTPPDPVVLQKGAEMGRFNMGSTVILLAANPLAWQGAASLQPVKMGEALAKITR